MRFEAASTPAVAGCGPQPALQDPPNVRAVARVASDFFLRTMDGMVRDAQGDLIRAIVFTAMWSANVRHITRSPANGEYSGRDAIAPDALRLPVSVTALASSLRIPYETVRRHVRRLHEQGTCVHVGRAGYIVPAAVHGQASRIARLDEAWASLAKLLGDLRRSAFDFSPYRGVLPNTVAMPPPGKAPRNIRALLRVGAEVFLRGVDTLGMQHDDNFLDALVYTAVWTANVRHITGSSANLAFGGLAQLPPDSARRPVTVHALAGGLGLPYETVRRSANRLVANGTALRKGGKGLIVPRAQMMRPECYRGIQQAHAHVVRLVGDLHRAGLDLSRF